MKPLVMTPGFGAGRALRCVVLSGEHPGNARDVEDLEEIGTLLQDDANFVWLDLAEPTDADLASVQERFGLQASAIEEASQRHERPKLEYFDDYIFAVVRAASLDEGNLQTHEIAIFAGRCFVVTIRSFPLFPLAEIERRWRTTRSIPRTGTGLLYFILDVIVDGFSGTTARYEQRLEALESHLFDSAEEALLQRTERDLFRFKRALTLFRAVVIPMRDITARLIASDSAIEYPVLVRSLRDVQDHLLHAVEEVDTIRDLLNSTYDLHLSIQNNREAQVNKQLTVIATIFLPITFITGFFGQNFSYLADHIAGGRMFWVLGIGSEIATLAIIYGFFKRKGWI